MLGAPNTAGAGSARAELGFRHVTLVRAWVGGAATRFEVDGIVHRLPVTRCVPAGVAARLVAAGVPLVTRDGSRGTDVPAC